MVNIRPVDEHAWKLGCVLQTLDITDLDEKWYQICSWLQMASSVEQVSLITGKFDSSLAFCSPALHYENERSSMLSNLALEITIFNFIWGAFESLVETLEPLIEGCNSKDYGKVSTARYIIRKKRPSVFPGYKESLEKLISLYHSLIQNGIDHSSINYYEKGIFFVYTIRNKFAHGAYSLPEHPDDYEDPESVDSDLVKISSTIVLLTMQMMLCSFYVSKNIKLTNLFLFDELYNKDSIHLIPLLRNVHIKGYVKQLIF
ncbi:hypothetical protein [Gottfriedia acidiceleris]|uniref:hypothetical protein n=1 Tax=Gottfriedia acidiceleris TaxID=371036 RepID=UPI00101C17C2|nr:hypothetical protein [Gottfriedia acidiceleris]